MRDEASGEPAEPCPACGRPMESVHFNADPEGLFVLHGPPPDGLVARLLEPLTGSLVTDESGAPVLAGVKQGHRFPGLHCGHCRQIILRYGPGRGGAAGWPTRAGPAAGRGRSAAEGLAEMKWLDPMPVRCPSCGRKSAARVAELRSLRAACPGCGASLAAAGERMLAEEARVGGEIDLFLVGYELAERYGLADDELFAARSLGDFARFVAERLDPAADREERAAEIVAAIARRVAPLLLSEAGSDERIARLRLAYSKQAEPGAAPDPGGSRGFRDV